MEGINLERIKMSEHDLTPFGFCGLNCMECFNHKGEIADLARDLRKKLREKKRGK